MADTAGQCHALIGCYGRHRRPVARSYWLLWPTPQADARPPLSHRRPSEAARAESVRRDEPVQVPVRVEKVIQASGGVGPHLHFPPRPLLSSYFFFMPRAAFLGTGQALQKQARPDIFRPVDRCRRDTRAGRVQRAEGVADTGQQGSVAAESEGVRVLREPVEERDQQYLWDDRDGPQCRPRRLFKHKRCVFFNIRWWGVKEEEACMWQAVIMGGSPSSFTYPRVANPRPLWWLWRPSPVSISAK